MSSDAQTRFLSLLHIAVNDGTLVKLTLGKSRSNDATLKNLFVRPVTLKAGPHLSFLWRHDTRDVTKNHSVEEALEQLDKLIGSDFLDAHLFTTTSSAQLECQPDGSARLHGKSKSTPPQVTDTASHDRPKTHLIPPDASWLNVA